MKANFETIKRMIGKGESEALEFKEKFDKESIETAAAFANAKGGLILVGVSDNSEVKGVKIGKDAIKGWTNDISQSTEPTVIPDITAFEGEGKIIVMISIKESPIKPVAYKGICYSRIRNSNKKLSPKEIAEMHLQTIGSSWDSRLSDAKHEEIDAGNVMEYIKLANQTGRKRIEEKPMDVLKKMDLTKDGRMTWAAVLLFGKTPQKFVSQARVHCGRFKDEITIIDDAMIEGTLIEQVDKTIEFVKKHLKLKFEITGEARRKEEWEYPLPAIREAVINAICHRDYTELGDIQIRIYEDELIVWSPGKLPRGITIEDLSKMHKSVLRNRLIAKVFFDIAFIESWGTGINRMTQTCIEQGLPKPIFEENQGVKVTFRRDIFTQDYLASLELNERQISAVAYVKKKKSITNKEYQQTYDVSERTASRELSELANKSAFIQVGTTGRGTRYILKDARKTPERRQGKD